MQSWAFTCPPTLVETVPISQVEPGDISPPACGHHCLPGRVFPVQSVQEEIYLLTAIEVDTCTAYLQEQSIFNNLTSEYARCHTLCLQREQSDLKASLIIACSGSGSFKGKGGWNRGINSWGSDGQLRASVSNGKIKKAANLQKLIPPIWVSRQK